jgi:hypothetical protein
MARKPRVICTATVETDERQVRLVVEEATPQYIYRVLEKDKKKPKSKETEIDCEAAGSVEEAKKEAQDAARNFLSDRDVKIPAIVWKEEPA